MINELINIYSHKLYDGLIILIANVYGKTRFLSSKAIDLEAEFFSEDEFDYILKSLKECGYTVLCYFDENLFICDYLENKFKGEFLIFNLARNGYGISKKSLIPTFCDLNSIKYTASNGYACSLSRHKYHVNLLLKDLGLNSLKSYIYMNGSFFNAAHFKTDTKYIIKPLFESASQGINDDSIYTYVNLKEFYDYVDMKYQNLNCSPLLIQDFIEGYEAKTTIIDFKESFALEPIGVQINGKRNLMSSIITSDIAFEYCHTNYLIREELGSEIADIIQDQAIKVYKAIGMQNYGRIDCRIDYRTKKIYFMDFSTMPYFVSDGEMLFSFVNMGKDIHGLLNAIINSALISKYYYSL